MTRVVNIRDIDRLDPDIYAYIGRRGSCPKYFNGLGSDGYYGNKHTVGYCWKCNITHSREDVIMLHRREFLIGVEADRYFRKRILELRDFHLVCFCNPLSCHGDTIAAWLNSQRI